MSLILAHTTPPCTIKTTGLLHGRKWDELILWGDDPFFGATSCAIPMSEFCREVPAIVRKAVPVVEYKGYRMPAKTFAAAVHYILTNTDLRGRADPRRSLARKLAALGGRGLPDPWGVLVEAVRMLRVVPGWNVLMGCGGGERLGRAEFPTGRTPAKPPSDKGKKARKPGRLGRRKPE